MKTKMRKTIFSIVLRVVKVFKEFYLIFDFTEKLVRNYLEYYSNKKLSKQKCNKLCDHRLSSLILCTLSYDRKRILKI